ncbi:retinol dehydrogenase 16-like [Arvicola amphibius]|uniref:retinol dehydrogenase 16-like n=1 Tax=Arvicola amphibius TaxID=1047088 RepID=UPI0018E2D0E3|nr:retinol dehydrogenase 16-like [Arvicola amphibius]
MWLYLVALVGLWTLLRLIRERQVVSHLQDKHVFITGCDSGFGNLLARQLDRRGTRVLAACLTEKGAEELRNKTSDRLETVILDVTKTDSIVAATQWVKERVGNRDLTMLKSLDQRCKENLSLMTDYMEHALTSCHPRLRYSTGWDAKLFFIPVSYLPTCLADAFFYWTSLKPDKAL